MPRTLTQTLGGSTAALAAGASSSENNEANFQAPENLVITGVTFNAYCPTQEVGAGNRLSWSAVMDVNFDPVLDTQATQVARAVLNMADPLEHICLRIPRRMSQGQILYLNASYVNTDVATAVGINIAAVVHYTTLR